MIRFLLDPFNILWTLLLFTLLFLFLNKWKVAKWMGGITVAWLIITSTPFLPTLLLDSLESRFEPLVVESLADREVPYHILVHGGGHGFDDRLPPNSLLSDQAMKRLSEGIRLYHKLPNSVLVLSGFSSSGRTTQAEMLRDAALLMGVDEDRTIMQTEPGNTFEEAKVYAERFGNSNRLIVVTSAAHMPRVMMTFKMFEIDLVPSPTHYSLKGSHRNVWFGLPSSSHMGKMRIALNEYAAMLWYQTKKEF